MELKYIVYLTINLCNGKFYIGVHETNPEVFDGYIGGGVYRDSNATKDTAFHRAVRKYGCENFKRTTLRIFPHTEEGKKAAYALEAELVTETVLRSKTCYNTSVGGQGGVQPKYQKPVFQYSLDGKLLNTYPSTGLAAKSISTTNLESAKQAIKNNCAGRTKSAFGFIWSRSEQPPVYIDHKLRPVAQYTLSGKFIRHFGSIEEACATLHCSTIYQAINKHYQAAGHQWKYFDGDTSDIMPLVNRGTKFPKLPIQMFTLKGEFVAEYSNVRECVKANKTLRTNQINRVLSGVMHSHRGFVFKYKDEDIV